MPIAMVAPLVTPVRDRQLGGSQVVACELTRGLRQAGEEVELFAVRGSRVSGLELRLLPHGPHSDALLRLTRPCLRRLTPVSWPPTTAARYLALAATVAVERPPVVHNHGQDWPAFYALAATGLPTAHTLHLPPLDTAAVAAAAAAARCLPRPRFVAPSRVTARQWRAFVPVDAVIGNGVDPASVPFSPRPVPDLAVVPGRISPEKGTHLAIDAARSAGLRVLVVGPVYDRSYHLAEVVPRLLPGAVRWAGAVSRSRLARLVGRAAVAVVVPRWEEPFGLVAVEANLAGTPVAGVARGALPEVVGRDGGVLVEGCGIGSLRRAVVAALALPRERVRRQAERRHSLAATVDAYRALYQAMVR